MEKSLQEVLHENKLKVWEKEKARLKKQQKKENILFVGIVLFIAIITSVCLLQAYKDLDSCKTLHNEDYCIAHS